MHGSIGTLGASLRSELPEVLRVGANVAYVALPILTSSASLAFAAGSDPSGICSTATDTGGTYTQNTDFCNNSCTSFICDRVPHVVLAHAPPYLAPDPGTPSAQTITRVGYSLECE